MKVCISRGLRSTDKEYEEVPVAEIDAYLKKHRNCYERTFPLGEDDERKHNRVYVDIDGKVSSTMSGGEFADYDDHMIEVMKLGMDKLGVKEYAMMSSSQKPKLSYRIHFKNIHGTKPAIEHYIRETLYPIFKESFSLYCPLTIDTPKTDKDETQLNLDTAIYNPKGRKMRMCGSSKDGENRPLHIVNNASVQDTLITYILPNSTLLPEPVQPLKPSTEPKREFKKRTGERLAPLPAELVVLREVLDGVNPARFDHEPEWFMLGQILFNLGCDYAVFADYSSRSAKFNEEECKRKWSHYRESSASDNTFWWWLKNDNPDLYKTLQHKQTNFWKLIGVPNHANTATYFYNLKPHAYAYHQALGWYVSTPSGVWEYSKDPPKCLLSDITQTITKDIKHYQRQIDITSRDPEDEERLKLIRKFEFSIGQAGFVEGAVKFISNDYILPTLEKMMDENKHLFAFKNKVVDLRTGDVRDIRPTDYICINTGYDYPENVDAEAHKKIKEILWSIWEDQPTIDYVMKTIALCLCGLRIHEEFYIWTGAGGNGKGLLALLVMMAFGGKEGYYHPVPASVLTKPSDGKNATNSSIAMAKGKRVMMATEPDDKDQIQIAALKEMTGGDPITARQLYKDPITFTLQCGIFIQANTIPKMSKLDANALTRRLRCIPFPFDFKDEDDVVEDTNMRVKDTSLKQMILEDTKLRDAFVRMLLDIYPTIAEAPKMTKMVADKTSEYIDGNNKVKAWLWEYYERVDAKDKKYWVGSQELRQRFFIDTGMPETHCDKQTFKDHMGYCGVEEKRCPNFKVKDGDDETERKGGMYWLGLKRKEDEGTGRRRLIG